MEKALVISQIIFYSIYSLAGIVLFFFVIMAAYRLSKILKILQAIAKDVHDVSDQAKARIKDISEKLSLLPILSFFMKKAKGAEHSRAKAKK